MAIPTTTKAFIAMFGMNTHIGNSSTVYFNNPTAIKTAMTFLGFGKVRDTIFTGYNTTSYNSMLAGGLQYNPVLNLAAGAANAGTPPLYIAAIHQLAAANFGAVIAVEGPNEVIGWPVTFNALTGIPAANAFQAAVFADVRADSLLSTLPVLMYTFGGGNPQDPTIGNQSASATFGNVHLYPQAAIGGGITPLTSLQSNIPFQTSIITPSLNTVITEGGYYTSPVNTYGVNNDVQMRYMLDYMCDAALLGLVGVYFYELFDNTVDPGNTNSEFHFGVFNSDFTPKPSATAIHNFTTILADSGTTTNLPLSFSVSGLPNASMKLALAKSNGANNIIVWAEPTIWTQSTHTQIAAPVNTVTITLPHSFASVKSFDPTISANAQQTLTNVSAITVQVTDHPIIIEAFSPLAPGPVVPLTAQTISPTAGNLISKQILASFSNTNSGFSGSTPVQANALPIVITEFGYPASGGTPNGRTVDIATQGKNILNGILNAWNQNIRLVCIQELYDQGDHYGLMSSYGTPYNSGTYLANFTSILDDPGANNLTFIPSSFNYTLLNTSPTMSSTLLQKANGNTQVVIWNSVDNWNISAGTANTIPTTNISVTLASGASGNILVFDPTIGQTPIATATATRTITFGIKDSPIIVDVSHIVNNSGTNIPSRTTDFLNIIGINGNIAGNSSIYINSGSSIVTDLQFLGVNIYRDGLQLSTQQTNLYRKLANSGVKMVVVPPNSSTNNMPYTLNVASIVNGINTLSSFSNTFLYAIEGCDSPNTFPITFNGANSNSQTFMPVANFMKAYVTAISSIPAYNTTPIYSATDINLQPDNTGMQFLTIPNGNNTGGIAGPGGNYGGGGAGTSIKNGIPGAGGQGIIVITNIPASPGFAWLDSIVYSTFSFV